MPLAPRSSYVAGLLVGLLSAWMGCGGSPTFVPEEIGALPGLKASPHAGLQDELARIVEQGGLPEQLDESDVADESNVAAGVMVLFPLDAERLQSIFDASARVVPPRGFDFDPVRLQNAIEFRAKYHDEWKASREALRRPQCDFRVEFLRGPLADAAFVDVVRICGRLEACAAAEALAPDKPGDAVEALAMMLQWAGHLGAEPHPVPRLEAAFLRSEAFAVAQAIVQHPRIARADLESLAAVVAAQLAAWPDDAKAWIGDRALGMFVYEMVRRGELLAMLSEAEMEAFRQAGSLRQVAEAARRIVDTDQLFYLDTMRNVIEGCRRPYHARADVFRTITADLEHRRDTSDFPLVAELLLKDLRNGQAIQARDRANWEAWLCGLHAALGRPIPFQTNPLTGKPYLVDREDDFVTVRGIGTEQPGDDSPIGIAVPAE